MSARKALGKGLGALMPTRGALGVKVLEIPLEQISANINQPRKSFDDKKLKELAASIKENGVIQPVLVQKSENGYELIAGERRFRASRLLKLATIPAIVKLVERDKSVELALIENIQREELNPIEEAQGYRQLHDEFGLSQEQVGKKVGKDRSTIANMLRLLKLPREIQDDIRLGKLTAGHARALLACETETAMIEMRKQILEYGLNVRDVEAKAKKKKSGSQKKSEPVNQHLRIAADALQKAFSTKVLIKPNKKGGGQIVVEYYSDEDLERILESI